METLKSQIEYDILKSFKGTLVDDLYNQLYVDDNSRQLVLNIIKEVYKYGYNNGLKSGRATGRRSGIGYGRILERQNK